MVKFYLLQPILHLNFFTRYRREVGFKPFPNLFFFLSLFVGNKISDFQERNFEKNI